MDNEIAKAQKILHSFAGGIDLTEADLSKPVPKTPKKKHVKIPPEVIEHARGIAIYSTFRAGMGLAGSAGSGLVMARLPDGSWSPPSAFSAYSVGAGLVWGADVSESVCIPNTNEAVRAFTQEKFSLGADLGVTAGPVGTSAASLAAGAGKKPVWIYTKSKGFFLNIQVDGTGFSEREDVNAEFYGKGITSDKILRGDIDPAKKDVARKVFGWSA